MTEIYEKKNAKRKGFSKYNDAFDYFDDDLSIAYSTIIKGKFLILPLLLVNLLE